MSRKAIHITVPERLMQRFEQCLEAEGLTKTVFLTSKIQEFCDHVESKREGKPKQGYSDEQIEYTMREAKASFEIEDLYLPEGADELIRKRLRREISHDAFIKEALEIAKRG
jgi:predicted DNA-binding protein